MTTEPATAVERVMPPATARLLQERLSQYQAAIARARDLERQFSDLVTVARDSLGAAPTDEIVQQPDGAFIFRPKPAPAPKDADPQ